MKKARIGLAAVVVGLSLAGIRMAFADTVYLVSFTGGGLYRYDSADPGATLTTLLAPGSLIKPAAIAIGPDGNCYIGEDGDGATFAPRISRFSPATSTLSTVVTYGAFDVFPASLVFRGDDLLVGRNPFFGNTGPIVKVANATGSGISVSDYTTGGSLGSSPGLALGPDGRLYVSDQTYSFVSGIASGPVKQFDASGCYLGDVITSGSDGLGGPTGLVIRDATLYTASIMNGNVLQTDLTGGVTKGFSATGSPFEAGALAALSDGSLIVGSPSGSGMLYHFDSSGCLIGAFSSGLGQIGGVAVMPSDVDSDGLPDSWEQQIVDANPGDAIDSINKVSPTDDFDGDGMNNRSEFIAATQPTDPASTFRVDFLGGGGGDLTVAWHGDTGRHYSVVSADRLVDPVWQTNLFRSAGSNGTMFLSVNDLVKTAGFFRVIVERP